MENYLAFIMGIALLGMLVDGLTARYPAMQRQLYKIFFVVLYFLFVIRYYYGPDIWTYVPHYEGIASPDYLWAHPEKAEFEWGYDMFCSLMRTMGLSYWGMTAVITTLYFAALGCLFHSLKQYRLFALSTIILLDYNLICAENRQCLAVAMFIFMVLCLQKGRYLWALVPAVLVTVFHKSGFVPVGLTLMGALLYKQREDVTVYTVMIVVLMVMMMLPVSRVATPLLERLPLPDEYIQSAAHHLQLGRQFQIVALVYLAILVWISIYQAKHRTTYGWIALEVLIGMAIVVGLYQYYFMLNRMRSYFLPFVAYYVIRIAIESAETHSIPYASMIRQAVASLLILFCLHGTIGYVRGAKRLHAPIAKASTLFDLRKESPKKIRDRQMKIALRYWEEDYMKNENNKL